MNKTSWPYPDAHALLRGRERVVDVGRSVVLSDAVADAQQHAPTSPRAIAPGRGTFVLERFIGFYQNP